MSIPQDSPYRRAIDYGVFAVVLIAFALAVVRRVHRPVDVDQALVVTRAPAPQTQPAAADSSPESDAKPPRRRTRLDNDRLTPADLEPPQEVTAPDEPAGPPLTRQSVEVEIDPNTAAWWELAELPGIGEVKGRAIVAYREQFRQAALAENPRADPPPAFQKPEDLDAVKGIGPATIEKMRPMLVFDAPPRKPAPLRPRSNR